MPTLSLGAPPTANSDQTVTYTVAANGTAPVNVTSVQLAFNNRASGGNITLTKNFSPAINIAPGAGGVPVDFDVRFNDLASQASGSLLPQVCGAGVQIAVEAFGLSGTSLLAQSPEGTTEVVKEPCICTAILDVFTTIDAFPCVSPDGLIGVEGKLFEVNCVSGFMSPWVNQGPVVLIGLEDPITGIFYQFVAAPTDNFGTFSVGFAVKNRTDVVALIPADGSKQFILTAFFPGSSSHVPSPPFVKNITISGAQAASIPCPLGTLVKDTVYATAPMGAEVHTIQQGFVGGLVVGGVTFSFQDLATQVTNTVHDAIVSSGTAASPVTPLEIKVYRGPDIQVPAFFGFIGIPKATFIVVATAMGSPIAGLVIAAIVIAAIVALALFFVYLIFSVVKDIIAAGGGSVLGLGAVAVIAVAGVAGFILYTQRKRLAR